MRVEVGLQPSGRYKDGLAAISVRVPERELDYDLDVSFKELHNCCGVPDLVTLDLLVVASLCYVVDKVVSRKHASDNWTRELEVEFPVSNPDAWDGVAGDFEAALSFLTGDLWQMAFRKAEAPFFRAPRRRRRQRRMRAIPTMGPATCVCLFSGGLDSLTGAIDLLAEQNSRRVLLVGHRDAPGPGTQQKNLFAAISKQYPRRAELLQTRVSHKPDSAKELTLRSRSLVFVALGIYAARAFGNEVPLYAPENGLIAINVPLTPSRSGSCSTRTMHPFFLEKLGAALRGLAFSNRIINPFQLDTKGECITNCRDSSLLRSLVPLSVSCSHGTRRQNWVRKGANNCGYCVPCLIRRAALHKAGIDDGQQYGIDVCKGEMPIDDEAQSADDLRAMLDFLYSRKSHAELSREVRSVAPVKDIDGHVGMVERGVSEMQTLFRDKAISSLRRASGIVTSKR